jgi:hypothetical protein
VSQIHTFANKIALNSSFLQVLSSLYLRFLTLERANTNTGSSGKSLAEDQEMAAVMSVHVLLCYNICNVNISKKNACTKCSTSESLLSTAKWEHLSLRTEHVVAQDFISISDSLGLRSQIFLFCFGS